MSPAPLAEPSPWLLDHLDALRDAARLGPVLDLACGRGRHARAIARSGVPVLGVDRDADHLAELVAGARREGLPVGAVRADLERPAGPPLAPGVFGAIAVFRYLHRPLCAWIAAALRPGGLLLYETFTVHQRDLGHGPGNPAFLLREGELPALFPTLEVTRHWEGRTPGDRPDAVARLAARRPV